MNNDKIYNNLLQEEDSIDIKKELGYYLFFWPWFLVTILIAFVSAFFYLRYADTVYSSSAQIQIKTDADPASFLTTDLDPFNMDKVVVENDIAVITSQHILSQVVKKLNLQTRIYRQGLIKNSLLFRDKAPFHIQFDEFTNNQQWTLEVNKKQVTISSDSINYTLNKGEVLDELNMKINLKDSLFLEDKSYLIEYTSLNETVALLREKLSITPSAKEGEIINLRIEGKNKNLNDVILNMLIQVLSEDQVADKRAISKVSMAFIDQRLERLGKSIDTISKNTIDYQMANGIFDAEAQTGNALNTIIKGQEEGFLLGVQLEIAKALKEQLTDQNKYELLPANVGIENESVNELVSAYNTIVTQRNSLLMSTTEQSPLVAQLSNQLERAKAAIITGVNRYIESLEVSLVSYQQLENRTRDLVASLPSKENTLRGFARNFKIVEELYMFLLQRKEEASISYISALPDLKILSYGVSG